MGLRKRKMTKAPSKNRHFSPKKHGITFGLHFKKFGMMVDCFYVERTFLVCLVPVPQNFEQNHCFFGLGQKTGFHLPDVTNDVINALSIPQKIAKKLSCNVLRVDVASAVR